jgi:hypothetical protein
VYLYKTDQYESHKLIHLRAALITKKYPERTKEKELGLLAKAKVKEWLVGDIKSKVMGQINTAEY